MGSCTVYRLFLKLLNRTHHEKFGFGSVRTASVSVAVQLDSGSIAQTIWVRSVWFGLSQNRVRIL